MWIGVALASLAILAAAGGIVYADIRTGGLDGYFSDRWQELTADSVGDFEGATRFTGVGLNGRLRQWEVAADAFLEEPALGLGAQNFEYYWYEHGPVGFAVRQPHSQPMQLLSELGLPGALLWLAFIAAALIYAATVRFRSSRWGTRVVVAAIMGRYLLVHPLLGRLALAAGRRVAARHDAPGCPHRRRQGPETSKAFSTPTATEAPLEAEHPGPTHEATNATALAGDEASESGEALGAPKPRRGESTEPRLRRSPVARTIAVAVALAALASAALISCSLRYSAIAAGAANLQQAADRADTAASLRTPTSIQPYSALAGAYMSAASAAPNAQERLRLLRLAVAAWQQALEENPAVGYVSSELLRPWWRREA